jgi:hypothetical protein
MLTCVLLFIVSSLSVMLRSDEGRHLSYSRVLFGQHVVCAINECCCEF